VLVGNLLASVLSPPTATHKHQSLSDVFVGAEATHLAYGMCDGALTDLVAVDLDVVLWTSRRRVMEA